MSTWTVAGGGTLQQAGIAAPSSEPPGLASTCRALPTPHENYAVEA